MKKQIDPGKIKQIKAEFSKRQKTEEKEIMSDGILCIEKYTAAKIRIMWVLKQNIHWGDNYDYAKQIKKQLSDINSVMIWRRLARASHGFLRGVRDFKEIKNLDISDLGQSLLSTAIIEANKELSPDVQSTDKSVIAGYEKYKDLVKMQIEAYAPDVVIVCMVGSGECLKPIAESIYKDFTGKSNFTDKSKDAKCGNSPPKSMDVAWSQAGGKTFLWAYHPTYFGGGSAGGISDEDHFDGLMNAFDEAKAHQR